MSKLLVAAATITLLSGAALATQTITANAPAQAQMSCDATLLSRSGRLTYLPGQNAWVSARGDLLRLAACRELKDVLIARGL
jgi:hypothetical protein